MAAPSDKHFTRELTRNDGMTINIKQSVVGDVGCIVWDAALVLTKYLESKDFDGGRFWKGKTVVELGSGTGVVGLFTASYGANVTITDLPEFLPLMEMNIKGNRDMLTGIIQAKQLVWGQDSLRDVGNIDVLLLADCIYYDESLEPLVTTINALVSRARTMVLCCHEERNTGNKPELERRFFQLISESFDVREIPLENQDPVFRSEDIHIRKFIKRDVSDVSDLRR